jgi:hypothetical protein
MRENALTRLPDPPKRRDSHVLSSSWNVHYVRNDMQQKITDILGETSSALLHTANHNQRDHKTLDLNVLIP